MTLSRLALLITGLSSLNFLVYMKWESYPLEPARILISLVAGFILTMTLARSMKFSALAGPYVVFIDHVVLFGGICLFSSIFGYLPPDMPTSDLLLGILVAYIFGAPISALYSLLGGWIGTKLGANKGVQSTP